VSGADYNRSPKTLRATVFTQTDPLQADVGSAYPSTYVYGNNNPNVYVDPSGMRGSMPGTSENGIAKSDPTTLPNELASTTSCGGSAHAQFDCALWDAWAESGQDFPKFTSSAALSLGGLKLTRFPNRFRRVPPVREVLGESGWNRGLLDGDNSPARHFIGFFVTASKWGVLVASAGLEANESGRAGSSEQDIRSGYYAIALAMRIAGANIYTDSQFRGFIQKVDSLTGTKATGVFRSKPTDISRRKTSEEYTEEAQKLMGS
jgi:hypothetical protein